MKVVNVRGAVIGVILGLIVILWLSLSPMVFTDEDAAALVRDKFIKEQKKKEQKKKRNLIERERKRNKTSKF